MEKIKKGNKAKYDGYIITDDEQKEYLELKEKVATIRQQFQEYKKEYNLL